jgi:catechol 2,3-dioxygenase-like lactoylglutathione lyase family enzyme
MLGAIHSGTLLPFAAGSGAHFRKRRAVQSAGLAEDDMLVQRLDHVQLAMPAGGEARARDFYQGILGIPEVPKPPHLAKRGGCWFEAGQLKIHLGVESDFRPARKAHPGLIVSDLRVLADRLQVAGYTLRDDEPLEGYDRVYVEDPFGNRLELLQPHPQAGATA